MTTPTEEEGRKKAALVEQVRIVLIVAMVNCFMIINWLEKRIQELQRRRVSQPEYVLVLREYLDELEHPTSGQDLFIKNNQDQITGLNIATSQQITKDQLEVAIQWAKDEGRNLERKHQTSLMNHASQYAARHHPRYTELCLVIGGIAWGGIALLAGRRKGYRDGVEDTLRAIGPITAELIEFPDEYCI
jgi:hypothetical protein